MASEQSPRTRNDSGILVHTIATQNGSPPTSLSSPEVVSHQRLWEADSSPLTALTLLNTDLTRTRSLSHGSNPSSLRDSGGAAEFGVATAVMMPARAGRPQSTTINIPTTPTKNPYPGYEHGAPLSDIGEESDLTPIGRWGKRISVQSASPSPPTSPGPQMYQTKRSSALSISSAGSDIANWEEFDSSKVLSDRVAADIERMKEDDQTEIAEAINSRRNSKEVDDELAILNEKAEKILASARKRLTHMEDNLSKARDSVLLSPRSSPNIGEHQPAGGLYRSISAAGQSRVGKPRPFYLPIRTNPALHHGRGLSDTGVPSGLKRLSRMPEIRSASALEYDTPTASLNSPDASPLIRFQPSPTSSQSFNSPLRALEEEQESPSTVETTPESAKTPREVQRGLGIHASGSIPQENLAELTRDQPSSTAIPISVLLRSSSQASTRSTKELKEQMTDLRSRIANLRSKAQANHTSRTSSQGLRTSSPFNNAAQSEEWYTSPVITKESTNKTLTPITGKDVKSHEHEKQLSATNPSTPPKTTAPPITPNGPKYLNLESFTPGEETALLSSARTDRNTPSLARAIEVEVDDISNRGDSSDRDSPTRASIHHDINHLQDEPEDEEQIAKNEEEQIYLNEVLEESLREAEVEPVPMIPGVYLDGIDDSQGSMSGEFERHEDRLDAFDYENMFLHSAMGTYTGKSLNGSISGSESDAESVSTRRADVRTPMKVLENDSDGDDEERDRFDDGSPEPATDDEMEGVIGEGKSPGFSGNKRRFMNNPKPQPVRTPPRMNLPNLPAPWLRDARSNSMTSVSTTATYQTATEGGHTDEEEGEPDEILQWGGSPVSLPRSPPRNSFGHTHHIGQAISPRQATYTTSPRSLPLIGERSATSSVPTVKPSGMMSSNVNSREPSETFNGVRNVNGYMEANAKLMAQRARLINDNGYPERFQPSVMHERQYSSTQPLPAQDLQSISQQHSRKQSQSSNHTRSQPGKPSTSMPTSPSPNTEILMESLIKLAEPDFSILPGMRFAEVDKELVLGLLRAVGGVCNGVLRADQENRSDVVEELRSRLQAARITLNRGVNEGARAGQLTMM